jgi:hypothetical protein
LSLLEVIQHANHDRALAEQQRAFEDQRCLVVQQVLPPFWLFKSCREGH